MSQVCKPKNNSKAWVNEWMTGWMNEWMNEWIDERKMLFMR